MRKMNTGHATAADHMTLVSSSLYDVTALVNEVEAPRVSVIVPTYNRRGMLKDTLDALFTQDFAGSFEVIVVDDASHDGTELMLAEAARRARCGFKAVRLWENHGAPFARNVGLALARGEFIAFTDSDCVPAPGWLRACDDALSARFDVVQGRTVPPPWERKPLFSHYIQTATADGLFTTANAAYRRSVVMGVGGFNPECDYWEDVDLGWRSVRAGARYGFAPEALVWHQVIVQRPQAWIRHVWHFTNWPIIAAHYPEFRRHLFLRVWVDSFHVLVTLAAAGIVLSPFRRRFALMALPYVAAFPFRHGLRGRWPLLKAAAHLGRDWVAFSALLWGSIRYKSPVL
jgi:glycosyltransferase involved in cell wall biosynthesis